MTSSLPTLSVPVGCKESSNQYPSLTLVENISFSAAFQCKEGSFEVVPNRQLINATIKVVYIEIEFTRLGSYNASPLIL